LSGGRGRGGLSHLSDLKPSPALGKPSPKRAGTDEPAKGGKKLQTLGPFLT